MSNRELCDQVSIMAQMIGEDLEAVSRLASKLRTTASKEAARTAASHILLDLGIITTHVSAFRDALDQLN